jgi:ABC-type polysaccharide/polyol phosphate transport system ATPase subunit
MAAIRLTNVSVRYPVFTPRTRALKSVLLSRLGGTMRLHDNTVVVEALRALDLELSDGDRLAIVGHNGAGKTTLLRVIAGVYEPQQGTVEVEGQVSSFVDITLGMDPEATGWDNIVLRGVFMGLTFAQARALAPSIAEFSELGQHLDMPVRTYSTGMYMRLAFAITTSVQPEIIVMDEMIGAGDARFLDKAKERLDALLGRTSIVVLASHSEAIVSRFCNKALWLEKGEPRAFGSVEEVLGRYRGGAAPMIAA